MSDEHSSWEAGLRSETNRLAAGESSLWSGLYSYFQPLSFQCFTFGRLVRLWLTAFLCMATVSVIGADGGKGTRASSTAKTATLLKKLAAENVPAENLFLNDLRVPIFEARLAGANDPGVAIRARFDLATELLNAGQTLRSIEEYQTTWKTLSGSPGLLNSKDRASLRIAEAMAHLRLGEVENCISNHTSESCLLPIQRGGVHKYQRGSRAGIEILTEQLSRTPNELSARWLLNVAYMTVGEYPDKVPPQLLIPPTAFASECAFPRFPDVAAGLGLDLDTMAGGVVADDFDGDNLLDLLISAWGFHDQLRFFRNNGDGTFTDATEAAGIIGEVGGLNMISADYNNDGNPDVLVLRGAWMGRQGRFPCSLLRGDGKGHFTDVTEEAGLLAFHPTQTATWLDFNNDGWIDLFVGSESAGPEISPCRLYRNNRNGTFTERAKEVGVANVGFVKAVISGDFNNDGLPDLYLSRLNEPNVLYRNDGSQSSNKDPMGAWKFTDVAMSVGVGEPLKSFPGWFFDYDNDGWLDLFVSGYYIRDVGDIAADYLGIRNLGAVPRLYHNNRDGTFTDVAAQAGLNHVFLTMGCNFGDLDNDGFLDFYLGTGNPDLSSIMPNRMFRNDGGKRFLDVTTASGTGHLQKGHAVVFADLDNDGDQDIYESIGGAYTSDNFRNVLFENPGSSNRWITLKLEGVKSNRAALGARIKIIAANSSGDRVIYKTVSTGGSFGASPFRQEIGLGNATAIRSAEIFWPVTGKTQVVAGLQPDHFYSIREGDRDAVIVNLKPMKFATKAGATHEHNHH